VWVWVEVQNGRPAEVSLELLSRARELATELGVPVGAALLGHDVSGIAADLICLGAETVYVAEHESLRDYLASPYARVVSGLIRRYRPQVVLYGASTTGRDLAPRVASTLRTGLTADCTDLRIGDHHTRDRDYEQLLYQIRPAFGGNIVATIVSPDHRPQMATVREGVFRLPETVQGRQGDVVRVDVAVAHDDTSGDQSGRSAQQTEAVAILTDSASCQSEDGDGPLLVMPSDLAVSLLQRVQQEKAVDLKGAQVIVAGGAGVGSKGGFDLIRDLAHTLGGVVAASRAAVDAGWIARDHQVGQTGTTVRPKLYIAAGISGSVQHRAGMDQSSRILAINTDPQAPIFSVANYGIVGDLHDVIPRIIRAYRSKA
jgi:electron transfer flavoprotein alpha subunit